MQLGRCLRNGLTHAEELCAFPPRPCSLPSLPRVLCLHIVNDTGLRSGGAPLDCPLSSSPREELEREVKGKTGAESLLTGGETVH